MAKKLLPIPLLLLIINFWLFALDADKGPLLRPFGELPEQAISSISVDQASRLVVTGSWDNSLKFWNLDTGSLLGTLVLPTARAEATTVDALASQPGGRLLVAGGRSTIGSPSGFTLFVIDRTTRAIIQTLTNLPGPVAGAGFSPDGQYLALALGGSTPLMVYRASGFAPLSVPTLPPASGRGLRWSPDGKLAFCSEDGTIHVLELSKDSPLHEIAVSKPWKGRIPFNMAWSPDSRRLAIVYGLEPFVEVLDGKSLGRISVPDVTGMKQEIYSLAFAAKGNRLMAGGRFNRGKTIVRAWDDNGLGKVTDLETLTNTIFDLVSLDDGSMLFGTADPGWGRIDPELRVKPVRSSQRLDLRQGAAELAVNEDATLIRFQGGSGPMFSLGAMAYTSEGKTPFAAVIPRGQGDELLEEADRASWKGNALDLPNGEVPLRFAEIDGGKGLLLGGSSHLSLYAPGGSRVWSVPVPYVLGLTVSGNGEVVIASLADGTIRWYCVAKGREVLALLPSRDGSSWLAWNPTGVYDLAGTFGDRFMWLTHPGNAVGGELHPVSDYAGRFHKPQDLLDLFWKCQGGEPHPFWVRALLYLLVVAFLALVLLVLIPGYILGWFPQIGVLSGFEKCRQQILRAGWASWVWASFLMAFPCLLLPDLLKGSFLARSLAYGILPVSLVLERISLLATGLRALAWLVPIALTILMAWFFFGLAFRYRDSGRDSPDSDSRKHTLELDEKSRTDMMQF